MFKLLIVTVLLGLAAAASNDGNAEISILDNEPSDAEGNYNFAFETSNGIAVKESGNAAGVSGAAQWLSLEGLPIKLTYTADQDGFHPTGDHLPVAPPIPEQIVRAIEYVRTHPPKEK